MFFFSGRKRFRTKIVNRNETWAPAGGANQASALALDFSKISKFEKEAI
jgi:hypothetical protein